jgi:hypothetical protein
MITALGHIHTDLNHRCRYQQLNVAVDKGGHGALFVAARIRPCRRPTHCRGKSRSIKSPQNLGGGKVRFSLFNKRANNIALPSLREMLFHIGVSAFRNSPLTA